MYDFLLVFYRNFVPKTPCFWDIRLQKYRDLVNSVRGPLSSLEMSPFDRAHTIFLLTFYSNYGSILCRFWDIQCRKNVVTLKSGSKVIQGHWKWYRSIDCVWFSNFVPTLTRTVFEIFHLEVYSDPETRVWDHSRSSKMILFDPAPMTSYNRSIVTIGLTRTISEIYGDFRRKSPIFLTSRIFISPAEGVTLGIWYRRRGQKKLAWWDYQKVEKVLR